MEAGEAGGDAKQGWQQQQQQQRQKPGGHEQHEEQGEAVWHEQRRKKDTGTGGGEDEVNNSLIDSSVDFAGLPERRGTVGGMGERGEGVPDIDEIHAAACAAEEDMYTDPSTGLLGTSRFASIN